MQLSWNLQVRSGQPDPLGAHVVHVRKNRRNTAQLTRSFGVPRMGIKIFDQHLIHVIVHSENPRRGAA
jgi:hypothetical protein